MAKAFCHALVYSITAHQTKFQHAPARPIGQRGRRTDPHRNSGTVERPLEDPEAETHGRGRIQSGQADAEIQVLLQTNEQRKTISGHSYLTD